MHHLRTVGFRNRQPLGFIRFQEPVPSVPAKPRDEFPSEVVYVLDAAVQAETTVRRKMMSGVAHQERAAAPPGVGNCQVVRPGPGVENLDRDVIVTDCLADLPFAAFAAYAFRIGTGRDLEVVPPASRTIANECALRVLVGDPDKWNSPAMKIPIQVGLELDVDGRAERLLAVLADTERTSHDAADPVGPDDVPGADLAPGSCGVRVLRRHAVVANRKADNLRTQSDRHVVQVAGYPCEYRFEHMLPCCGHELRRLRIEEATRFFRVTQ